MKIIIIGAGPGGYETALAAAKQGVEVVLIEASDVGGTCLNSGCIPTKTFCRHAQLIEEIRNSSVFGIETGDCTFNYTSIVQRKNQVVSQLQSGIMSLLKHPSITYVKGKASFAAADKVVVDGQEYQADAIIVATGSVPAKLPIPGVGLEGVLDSAALLDSEELPSSICIIGAGVIGLEFASILKAFGTKVTVLEYCKEILPRFDKDLAKRLKQNLSKKGIDIVTQARVVEMQNSDDGMCVRYEYKGQVQELISDKVLMAVGRKANLSSLNFSDLGITCGPTGVAVDENYQTNVPGIYAIGDINGQMMLAHAATYQGKIALAHILGEESQVNLSIMPAVVFTSPEVATVGLTEEDCESAGIPYKCFKSFYRANGKAVSAGETDGYCKLIATDDKEQKILGCHILGAHSSDIIQEVAALMYKQGTIKDLSSIVHPHPTLSEVISAAVN